VSFNVTHQLLIRFLAFARHWRKKWEYKNTVHKLLIDLEVLYNILIQLGVPMKLAGLIKICLKETYNNICTNNYLPDNSHIQNCLKQDDSSRLLFNLALEFVIRNT
jgi:hypothetical protein